jgi:hypothetical protein
MFKCGVKIDGKRYTKRRKKGVKRAGRKTGSRHLLEEGEAIFKNAGKKGEKREKDEKSDGKKDSQYVFIKVCKTRCKGDVKN